jgi:hypothetical protein
MWQHTSMNRRSFRALVPLFLAVAGSAARAQVEAAPRLARVGAAPFVLPIDPAVAAPSRAGLLPSLSAPALSAPVLVAAPPAAAPAVSAAQAALTAADATAAAAPDQRSRLPATEASGAAMNAPIRSVKAVAGTRPRPTSGERSARPALDALEAASPEAAALAFDGGIRIDGRAFADRVALAARSSGLAITTEVPRSRYPIILQNLFWGEPLPIRDAVKPSIDYPHLTFFERSKNELYRWMMTQPDGSVSPEAFFQKSLELEKGDVWKALDLGWSILSAGRNFGGQERLHLRKTQKLADLRGDADQVEAYHGFQISKYHWTSKADNFSAWYHFWGAMTYAFYRDSIFALLPVPGSWLASLCALIEEGFIQPLEIAIRREFGAIGDTMTRLRIDLEGAKAGGRLARRFADLRRDGGR